MIKTLLKNKFTWLVLLYFSLIVIWWAKIFLSGQKEGDENYWFNLFYGLIALFGGIHGIYLSYRKWGGHRSVIGRGVLLLSLGLLGEWFGNAVWGYANVVLHQAIPYPGLADVGFFSIIPLYALAMISFAQAAGAKSSLGSVMGKIEAVVIPVVMVTISWALFLKNIPFDPGNPVKTFLDFGYPGGEAIAVAIAILTFSLSRKFLGGKMRPRILFVIIAFLAQYVTDYSFLYTAAAETYYNASFVDLFYAASLTLMALAITSFYKVEDEENG